MNKLQAIACLLACLLLVSGCGKQNEEIIDVPQTTAATEADTDAEAETEETTDTETAETEETTTDNVETARLEETSSSIMTIPETTQNAEDPAMTVPAGTDAPIATVPTEAPTEPTQPPAPIGDDVTFRFNDAILRVGDNALNFVTAVPANSSESAPSCYGNGEDINYYYDDFTIYVWNDNGSYTTVGIDITGPGLATQKGITIGSTANDVIAAYGSGYTEEAMDYVYTYGDCNLRFTIVDGQVHYISYNKDIEA